MPKRVIDGDALWVSEKLTQVPERFRVEYSWLLPLANANGAFECSPMLIWRTCYSALRPNWSIEDVAAMLDAFEAAKMLFRWADKSGKTFGFFIGTQKEGRLPKASDRMKSAKQWQVGIVPGRELAKFLGLSAKDTEAEYRDLLATNSRLTRDKAATNSPTGNRIGDGSGVGLGNGAGVGLGEGVGKGTGNGVGDGTEAAKLPSLVDRTPSNNSSSLQGYTEQHTTHHNTTEPSAVPPASPDDVWDYLNDIGYARAFRLILRDNPNAAEPPKGWVDMWAKDFKKLQQTLSNPEIFDILVISQLEKNQQFYVRSKPLVDNLSLLRRMVEERAKVMPALRAEFKKKYKQLEKKHDW